MELKHHYIDLCASGVKHDFHYTLHAWRELPMWLDKIGINLSQKTVKVD